MTSKIDAHDGSGYTKTVVPGVTLFAIVALFSTLTLAGPYKYSPDNPYPPPDPATVEHMKKGYLTGDATTVGYNWMRGDGKLDIPREFNPLCFLKAAQSFASQVASTLSLTPSSSK